MSGVEAVTSWRSLAFRSDTARRRSAVGSCHVADADAKARNPEVCAIEARKAVAWLRLDVVIPKVTPKSAETAPEWFQRLVDFVRAQSGTGALFLDRETGFPDLWAMFRDTE